jgi:hypothetical protein
VGGHPGGGRGAGSAGAWASCGLWPGFSLPPSLPLAGWLGNGGEPPLPRVRHLYGRPRTAQAAGGAGLGLGWAGHAAPRRRDVDDGWGHGLLGPTRR